MSLCGSAKVLGLVHIKHAHSIALLCVGRRDWDNGSLRGVLEFDSQDL